MLLRLRSALGVLGGMACFACSSDPATQPPPVSTAPCDDPAPAATTLGSRCGELVDTAGRVRYLRGVNARVEGVFDVTFSDGRVPLEPIPSFGPEDATAMHELGFDALRLPINWSGVEPTKDGGFDEAYLDRVQTAVRAATGAGLLVLIDLHQDAYSKEIGEDGAPLWAIEPPPTQLLQGPLEDLEPRRLSKQVLDAFETFFGDSPVGSALRERFVAMAEHVVRRFADEPGVIGLEIFNEPVADDAGVARLNEAAYARIRAAAPRQLYLFEPPVTRNFTDQSSLASAPLGPMTAYAPHVYTLAFRNSPAQLAAMTKETLRRSISSARAEAESWAAPLVITEWGFAPTGDRADDYYRFQQELQDEYRASAFVWLWKEQSQGAWGMYDFTASTQRWTLRPVMEQRVAHVRPMAVAGWPSRFDFDRVSGRFTLAFRADPTLSEPHLIAVPSVLGVPTATRCDGKDVGVERVAPSTYAVRCGGDSVEHELTLDVAAP